MYSLLIVDDEPIERSAIRIMVERNCKNIRVTGEAANGREAIDLAIEHSPEIIFMDIKMPGIPGLEAAAIIKQSLPEVMIVIISAYDYFEYARAALTLGVDDYLLKPTTADDVRTIIERVTARAEARNKYKLESNLVRQQLHHIQNYMQSRLIHILYKEYSRKEAEEVISLLGITFSSAFLMAVHIKESSVPKHISGKTHIQIYMQGFCEKVSLFFKTNHYPAVISESNGVVYAVIFDNATEISNTLEEYCTAQLQLKPKIKTGGICYDIDGLFKSMAQVRDVTLEAGADNKTNKRVDLSEYPYKSESELCESIRRADNKAAFRQIEDLTTWLKNNGVAGSQLSSRLHEVCILSERAAIAAGGAYHDVLGESTYFEQLNRVQNADDAKEFLTRFVQKLLKNIRWAREMKRSEHIENAVAYIEQSYANPIALEDAARAAALNPFYFSKLFKQEMGQNFIDYLTAFRMEKAQKLLRQKECSVKEASYRVGYNDPNYFSKTYKKYFGYSPTQGEG